AGGWVPARARRIAMAAIAPSTEMPAATASAGRYPLVTAAGPARLPRELKTAVTTAIPNTAPNCCIVLSVPAAFPSSVGGAALRPPAVTHGKAIPTPTPAATNRQTQPP